MKGLFGPHFAYARFCGGAPVATRWMIGILLLNIQP